MRFRIQAVALLAAAACAAPALAQGTIPIETAHPAELCNSDGHFVSRPVGAIESNIAGTWVATTTGGASTVDDRELGTRTVTIADPQSFGTLIIHANGTYSWGAVRHGRLRMYVPRKCFRESLRYQTFYAANNGLRWFYFHHDPGTGKLLFYDTIGDFNAGELSPK